MPLAVTTPSVKRRLERPAGRDKREYKNNISAEYSQSSAEAILNRSLCKSSIHTHLLRRQLRLQQGAQAAVTQVLAHIAHHAVGHVPPARHDAQLACAGDAGVEQVAVTQAGRHLRHRQDHRRELAALALVHRDGVGDLQFVEVLGRVHQPPVVHAHHHERSLVLMLSTMPMSPL